MKKLNQIWLHLFNGNSLSDRAAMVKFGYGAFRSRVSEKRGEFHIKDRWEQLDDGQSKVDYKEYFICPEFLKTKEAQAIRRSFTQKRVA